MQTKWLMRRSALTALATIAVAQVPEAAEQPAAQPPQYNRTKTMKIRIHIEGVTVTGTLEDNPTARDFAALLPLSVPLADYAKTEKVTDLPRRLSTQGAPAGFDPSIGDITYYAPWGNLAIFYRDFGYSTGLIKLGVIESGGATLSRSGTMQATIELASD